MRSRYLQGKGAVSKFTGYEECTFAPRVNNIKGEMGSAKEYLRESVFKRLSTPRSGEGDAEDGNRQFDDERKQSVMDMSSFMSSIKGAGRLFCPCHCYLFFSR